MELSSRRQSKILSPHQMTMHSLPVSTGAPRSASMRSSSTTFPLVAVHERCYDLPLSIDHSSNAIIIPPELISCPEVPGQPSWGNYPGQLAQAGHYANPLGGVQSIHGIDSVQRQEIPGSVTHPDRTEEQDEWSRYLELDRIITPDTTGYQMAGSPPPNPQMLGNMVQQSVAVPPNSERLYPTIVPEYAPAIANAHSPKRPKARMRWTVEMHDLFIDAVKQLGGSENAKPKAILDIMNVEGLTRDQVKSHLQKYKSARSNRHSSEDTLLKTTTPSEAVPLDVQIMQLEFQKQLHEMLEKTRRDILEIHTSMLNELGKRRMGDGTSTSCTAASDAADHA